MTMQKLPEQADHQATQQRVAQQIGRMQKAEHEQPTLLRQTAYIGVLGLLFVLPVVGGAYLGVWLDNRFTGYSISWTITLICLGVFVGAANVYFFIQEKD